MYGHSREVFFLKLESDLTQRICVKLGPCTTLVACAWCAFVARSVPRKKRTRQRFDSKKRPKTWFVFFVSDFANMNLWIFVLFSGKEVPLLRQSLANLGEQRRGLLIFRDPEHFLFRPLEVTTGIGQILRNKKTHRFRLCQNSEKEKKNRKEDKSW